MIDWGVAAGVLLQATDRGAGRLQASAFGRSRSRLGLPLLHALEITDRIVRVTQPSRHAGEELPAGVRRRKLVFRTEAVDPSVHVLFGHGAPHRGGTPRLREQLRFPRHALVLRPLARSSEGRQVIGRNVRVVHAIEHRPDRDNGPASVMVGVHLASARQLCH